MTALPNVRTLGFFALSRGSLALTTRSMRPAGGAVVVRSVPVPPAASSSASYAYAEALSVLGSATGSAVDASARERVWIRRSAAGGTFVGSRRREWLPADWRIPQTPIEQRRELIPRRLGHASHAKHGVRHEMPMLVASMGTPVAIQQTASPEAERSPVHASAQGWALHVLKLRLRLAYNKILLVHGLAAALTRMHAIRVIILVCLRRLLLVFNA